MGTSPEKLEPATGGGGETGTQYPLGPMPPSNLKYKSSLQQHPSLVFDLFVVLVLYSTSKRRYALCRLPPAVLFGTLAAHTRRTQDIQGSWRNMSTESSHVALDNKMNDRSGEKGQGKGLCRRLFMGPPGGLKISVSTECAVGG